MTTAFRTQVISFRLTRAERSRVARLRRKDETIHQTARRVLLANSWGPSQTITAGKGWAPSVAEAVMRGPQPHVTLNEINP